MVYVTFGKPHQQHGDYKEYRELYEPDYSDPNLDRNNLYSRFTTACRDGLAMKRGEQVETFTPDQAPQKVRISELNKNTKLRDAFRILNGVPLVSDRLRAIIERFDQGVHQFFPVDVTLPAGRKPLKGYHIIIVTTKKATIRPELSYISVNNGRLGDIAWTSYSFRSKGSKVVFSPDCRKGAHMWREDKMRGELFFSDELEAAMREEGVKFYEYWQGEIA